MEGLKSTAQAHLITLAETLIVAAFDAAVKPLTRYVTEITKSCIIWLFPSRENDTMLEIEARHLQDDICSDEESLRRREEQNKRIKRESEAREMRRKGEDDKEQLGQLQETIRAIDVQRANLSLERRRRADAKKEGKIVVANKAREVEDPRPTREPREPRGRKPVQEPRKRRPVDEARQAEKTKGIETARQIKDEMLFEEVQEATKRGLVEEAREVEETKRIEIIRLAEKEVLVEDAQQAEERGLAEEARQAEESRRIEDERIRVADEISMVKKRVKRVRETGRERRGVGQTVNEPRNGIQPTVWPSKEELQLAKEKTQYSPVHFGFAVTGASGSGKSSLINIFLDLPDNHENGARTDVIETTSVLTRYPDPGDQPPRKWTVWYDVPGAGTSAIPAWQYFNQQHLFVFDLILVVFDNRITEIDLDILRNCRRFNIPSFIIRSKADVQIKNRMKSSGYESGDDAGDPDLRRKCRDHFITNTRQSVERELEKAALPPQKVYIVSCSKQFRREYSTFTSGLDQSTDGSGRERFVDEMELIHDLMLAAASRRCDIQPKETLAGSRDLLISRLRTGQVEAMGVPMGCQCKEETQDVQHILLRCSLTQAVRGNAKKALGVKKLTFAGLLYEEKGMEWAERLWQKFAEAKGNLGCIEDPRRRRRRQPGRGANRAGSEEQGTIGMMNSKV